MKKGLIVLLVVIGIMSLIGLSIFGWITGTYNSFVGQRTGVETSWAQVETQYQRRFDLIPQLVGATKGFLAQEQKVFGDIATARTHYAGSASGSDDRVAATGQMEGALSRLLVVMENYPQLTSNQTVRDLMVELAGTANRVNVAQQRYNEVVQEYDTHVHSFPDNLIASHFNFKDKPLFTSENGANKAPTVDLMINNNASSTK